MAAMNNLPAMTEEQRELEIASVKEMRSHVDFWGHASGFDAEFLMRCADAYLAMLTAKPVGYVSSVSREIANDGRLGYISNHIVAGLEGGYVYEAPPVPVLRVPDEKEHYPITGESEAWKIAHNLEAAGFNECLAEIKRLNTQTAPPEASNEQ